jgi:hypothetical protein
MRNRAEGGERRAERIWQRAERKGGEYIEIRRLRFL